jgi:hypothetical protein
MVDWTDELWEEVWERTLDQVERHHIARDVWFRRLPDDLFHRRIAPELARRWRRAARNQAVLCALWVLFWGTIARGAHPDAAAAAGLSTAMVLFGGLVLLACFGVRRRVAPLARLQL